MGTPPPAEETFPIMVEEYNKGRKILIQRYRPGVCAFILAFARRHLHAFQRIEQSDRHVKGSPAASQATYHRAAFSAFVDLASKLDEPVDGDAWTDGAAAAWETYLG